MRNIALLFCAFCIPYLCTVLWGNSGRIYETDQEDAIPVFAAGIAGKADDIRYLAKDHGWYEENVDMEEYIAECLASYAPDSMGIEAKKALAVVLRTELKEGQNISCRSDLCSIADNDRSAAEETRGILLSFQGAPIHALWTYVSNGSTRDGNENHIASSACLKKKDCGKDILSKEYSSKVIYEKKQFEDVLVTIAEISDPQSELERDDFGWPVFSQIRDSAGYTKKILVGAKEIEGSVFADAFFLKSPSFDIEFRDENVIFYVTGYGHGFGMSLYTADRMAEEGKDFMEILSFFYPGTELKK